MKTASGLPSTVEDLIHASTGTLRGQVKRAERLRIKAFEMYLTGELEIPDIAKELRCSRQYLYRIAKVHDWATRKSKLQAMTLVNGNETTLALVDVAREKLQSKVNTRLLELEELCEKRNLKAILAWLQMAGLGKFDGGGGGAPRSVEVTNDLSDRRQVTVIQDSASRVLPDPPVIPDGKSETDVLE